MHTLTKKFASVAKAGVAVLLGAALLVSCSKERFDTGAISKKSEITDKETQKKIMAKADKLPAVGVYNSTMDKVLIFSTNDKGEKSFSFANPPSGGISFASSQGGQWVTYPDEPGGLIIITEPGGGFGNAGTVVIGSTTLDIGYAFCFAVGDEVLGMDLFDSGIDQVAGVIGIAGDLEALSTGNFDEGDNLFDYFHGFVYYLVYAEDLNNQDYEVLDWLSDLDQDEEDLDGFGFAFAVHFVNQGGIYLSESGTLAISGASMSFNGTYFGIEGLFFFDDGEGDEPTFVSVPGFGTMGCD
jgi:hypothetical protein